jgi:hypothetical protein
MQKELKDKLFQKCKGKDDYTMCDALISINEAESFINQNFIGKEEVVGTKNKIEETLRITEENYPNEINISILVERLKVLLELIK